MRDKNIEEANSLKEEIAKMNDKILELEKEQEHYSYYDARIYLARKSPRQYEIPAGLQRRSHRARIF